MAAGCVFFALRLPTSRGRVLLKWYGRGLFWASLTDLGSGTPFRVLVAIFAKVALIIVGIWGAMTFIRWLHPKIGDVWQDSESV
jgi:hypothetical protein